MVDCFKLVTQVVFKNAWKHFLDLFWLEATTCETLRPPSSACTKWWLARTACSWVWGLGGEVAFFPWKHGPSTWLGKMIYFPSSNRPPCFSIFFQPDFNGHTSRNVWRFLRIQYPDWLLREEDHPEMPTLVVFFESIRRTAWSYWRRSVKPVRWNCIWWLTEVSARFFWRIAMYRWTCPVKDMSRYSCCGC